MPAASHITGIFQYHQAIVLKQADYKVGALSVRQDYSIPMILRAAAARTLGRRVGNALDGKPCLEMGRLLRDRPETHGHGVPEVVKAVESGDGCPRAMACSSSSPRPSPSARAASCCSAQHGSRAAR